MDRYIAQRSAEYNKGVCDLPLPELPDFYEWFDGASREDRIAELAERIDWLAGHICVGNPPDTSGFPYWGSEELYRELDRCRFIAQWGVRKVLPSNVLVVQGQ